METLFNEIVAVGGSALALSVVANVMQWRQNQQLIQFIQDGYAAFTGVMGEVKMLLELLNKDDS